MRVGLEHAVDLGKQLAEPRVREDLEPVVARRLAVLQPRRRADGAVLLERLVGRIGDDQVDGFRRQIAEPVDRIARRQLETHNSLIGGYERNASFYADAHPFIERLTEAGHNRKATKPRRDRRSRRRDLKSSWSSIRLRGCLYCELGIGSWEFLFAGSQDAQRLHAHLMIDERAGRLDPPPDIGRQPTRQSAAIDQLDVRRLLPQEAGLPAPRLRRIVSRHILQPEGVLVRSRHPMIVAGTAASACSFDARRSCRLWLSFGGPQRRGNHPRREAPELPPVTGELVRRRRRLRAFGLRAPVPT